ncbi:hypothetical protein [Nocardia canadensis]|nr:hypothetical protein [Nocardia canadensis]
MAVAELRPQRLGHHRAGPSERDQLGQPDGGPTGGFFDYAGIVPW